MWTKKDILDAYAKALLDYARHIPFVLFRDPNEMDKTVKGRLTRHNGNFYLKTPTHFYFIENSKRVQQIFQKNQKVKFLYNPNKSKLNGRKVNATIIE